MYRFLLHSYFYCMPFVFMFCTFMFFHLEISYLFFQIFLILYFSLLKIFKTRAYEFLHNKGVSGIQCSKTNPIYNVTFLPPLLLVFTNPQACPLARHKIIYFKELVSSKYFSKIIFVKKFISHRMSSHWKFTKLFAISWAFLLF